MKKQPRDENPVFDEMVQKHIDKVGEAQAENEKLTAKLLQDSQTHLDKIRKKNERFRNR